LVASTYDRKPTNIPDTPTTEDIQVTNVIHFRVLGFIQHRDPDTASLRSKRVMSLFIIFVLLPFFLCVPIFSSDDNDESSTSVILSQQNALTSVSIIGNQYQLVRLQSLLPTNAQRQDRSDIVCQLPAYQVAALPPFLLPFDEQFMNCDILLHERLLSDEPQFPEASFDFKARFARGAHGELWIAKKITTDEEFVLKRIFSSFMKRTALREIYFGRLLASLKVPRVAHLVEWFEGNEGEKDLWLVYKNEGVSLSEWMYSMDQFGVRHVSTAWENMKRKNNGQEILQILRDVIHATRNLHQIGVTHRDIKVRNFLC
jgi:hypothetical protein